jgi:hypothetical protein
VWLLGQFYHSAVHNAGLGTSYLVVYCSNGPTVENTRPVQKVKIQRS